MATPLMATLPVMAVTAIASAAVVAVMVSVPSANVAVVGHRGQRQHPGSEHQAAEALRTGKPQFQRFQLDLGGRFGFHFLRQRQQLIYLCEDVKHLELKYDLRFYRIKILQSLRYFLSQLQQYL